MKRTASIWAGLFLVTATACGSGPGKVEVATSETVQRQMSPETLIAMADAKYAEYLSSYGGDRNAAVEKTAAYLRSQPDVKEVKVRGSDNLFVIFEDGSELFLMLGKNRL